MRRHRPHRPLTPAYRKFSQPGRLTAPHIGRPASRNLAVYVLVFEVSERHSPRRHIPMGVNAPRECRFERKRRDLRGTRSGAGSLRNGPSGTVRCSRRRGEFGAASNDVQVVAAGDRPQGLSLSCRRQRSSQPIPLDHAPSGTGTTSRQPRACLSTGRPARSPGSGERVEPATARGGGSDLLGGPQRDGSRRPSRRESGICAAALGTGPATTQEFAR